MKMYKHLNLFALAFGFVSTLTLCIIFYVMLFNQVPILSIETNGFGEFWIEFICINFMLLIIIIAFTKEIRRVK